MIFRRSLCILALATLPGVVIGCQTDDLRIRETDQFTPSGRVSYEFYPGNAKRRSGTLVDLLSGTKTDVTMQSLGVQPTISIDGAIAAVEGRDHHRIEEDHRVEVGNVEFAGPTRI